MVRNTTFQPVHTARAEGLRGLPLATFRARAAAFLIDIAVVIVLVSLVQVPLEIYQAKARGEENVAIHIDPFHGWGIMGLALYFGAGTWLGRGQTVGKRLIRIRVVPVAHEHLTLWNSVERALGYGASVLEGGFGFLQYFFHPNRQTVHDRIAETIVVTLPVPKP